MKRTLYTRAAAKMLAKGGFLCLTLAMIFSCAKATDEDLTAIEQQAFEEWMQKYVIGRGKSVAQQPNGMYVEFLVDGPQGAGDLSAVGKEVWVSLDYTGTDIEGNVFMTCSRDEALRQGSFTPHTHYTPDYLFAGGENFNMIDGQYAALKNELTKPDGTKIKLTKGSKVRLYMPSYLAMGSSGASDDQGYGGQFPLGGTKIVIEELEVMDVIENPVEREETLVKARAGEWGLSEAAKDTIVPFLFLERSFSQKPELVQEFPNKQEQIVGEYSMTVDSTATIRYIGRFLDGFVFDTNIQSAYDEAYDINSRYPAQEKDCLPTYYRPSSQKDRFIGAFYHVIPAIKRGQWYRIIFTSAYAYGATGMSAALLDQKAEVEAYQNAYYSYMYGSSMYGGGYYDNYYNSYDFSMLMGGGSNEIITEIQPYTPLIFEIYVETE